MSDVEYRVLWQREGRGRRQKLYQTRGAAERYVLVLQGRMAEATGEDPDGLACCGGYGCGCGGITHAEAWAQYAENIPPLVYGPVIEERMVGAWSPLARASRHAERTACRREGR